jgi:hypothetical protein
MEKVYINRCLREWKITMKRCYFAFTKNYLRLETGCNCLLEGMVDRIEVYGI